MIGDYSINSSDVFQVGDAVLETKGLVAHHLDSINDFYEIGLPQIIEQVFEIRMPLYDIKRNTEEEKNIDHIDILIKFSNVNIERPTTINYNSGKEEILYPNTALMKEKTYKSTLRVDVNIKATAVMNNGSVIDKEETIRNFKICKMPIMVASKLCNTYKLSKESLVKLHEDPSDRGGYFIIKGIEWVLDGVENILFNKVRIFRNEGYKKELMRAEFIAKPGDFYLNSDQFIIRWLSDGQITIEIRREKLKDIQIPFYLVFRIMGWVTDKQIFDNILLGYDTPMSKNMIKNLDLAFNAKYTYLPLGRYLYSQDEVLQYFAEELKDSQFAYLDLDNNPDNYSKVTNFLLENFDIHFIQHMGSNMSDRENKLRFLCNIIRKIFLVKMGNMEPTDRDSYNSKRVHAAGTSYAKSFKTNFNASVVQLMRRKVTKDFKSISFSQIDLTSAIKSSVFGAEFERSITQSITAGNKSQVTIGNRARINRLSSQLLNRKNELNVISTLRQVTVTTSDSSKQSERASEMRRVHLSSLGYICVTHSPEGERVGLNKQLAMFCFVTKATISETIKDILLTEDDEIYPLSPKIDYQEIEKRGLCNIYVNGDWIALCDDALHIAKKYRAKRRRGEISNEITIVWDDTQDEVYIWTDVGRVIRPLLIVYNNRRDPERFPQVKGKTKAPKEFFQGLALTADHIKKLYAKTIDMESLFEEGIIEFISAEEQENMYLAADFETLAANKNNELKEYTHCDIPQSMFGITALTSPFASHNQAQRIVYQTSQSKQTCGVFAKNWPYRADKGSFLQYRNEIPVVKTLSNNYLYPNGSNCIVAIACNTGYNVEDSMIMNQGAIDRGLFDGSKFTFYRTEIDQHEEFANPDITNTVDIKSACYDKLVNGIIKVGTVINKNDAIIGKIAKITKNTDENFQYADRSVIYKDDEQAIVSNVIMDRNEEDERFVKVVIRKIRSVQNGNKFSVIGTSQVLTDAGWLEIQDLNIKKHKVATLTLEGNLDYVYPTGLSTYEYDGDMYKLQGPQLDIFVTKNHKLYVKKRNHKEFKLLPTEEVFGKQFKFKKWANNDKPKQEYFEAKTKDGKTVKYPMNAWLRMLGMFISDGYATNKEKGNTNNIIKITGYKERKQKFHKEFLKELDIKYYMYDSGTEINCNKYPEIWNELKPLSVGAVNKRLPEYVWNLSRDQSRILLHALIEGDGSYANSGAAVYYTSSKGLSDDVVRLALHCGWSGNNKTSANNIGKAAGGSTPIKRSNGTISIATRTADALYVAFTKERYNEPGINKDKKQQTITEEYVPYKGTVYCLEIPDTHQHVYYSRESSTSPAVWSGNSARSGQKATIGLSLRESDMPSTEDGIRPSIIINPHALPSRMTCGQLIESLAGGLCAAKCSQTDATIFNKVDIESIATELEDLGLNRYGYRRLYNGITGEYIDTEIFMGPTYYQMLQKFTIDTIYAITNGPSDAITYQPLDGMGSGGGLRIGEMERDVIASHGASRFLAEKFFDHSDGYTEYVCRCGKSAVCNIEKGIYKCNYCKDNADIIGYNNSWSSKLFIHELETLGVGIRRVPEPFKYETSDDKIFEELLD
jgi:DNA-directed RNA polymerase beta subunit